jgi:hypothetical protein
MGQGKHTFDCNFGGPIPILLALINCQDSNEFDDWWSGWCPPTLELSDLFRGHAQCVNISDVVAVI